MGFLDDAMHGNYSTVPTGNVAPSPVAPVANGGGQGAGDILTALISQLNNHTANTQGMIVNRPQVQFPQQLPPGQNQPGDASGNFVNPNTVGGPARNARVGLAQSIGQLVSKVENQHEMKKARDIAFDIQRLQTAMENPTPENQQLVNEVLSDPSRRKAISKALNINFMGGEDKRKNVDKLAHNIWTDMNKQKGQQQNGQQPQQQQQQQPQQQGPNYYQQLERMFPQTPQLSTEANLQIALTKAGLAPTSGQQLSAITKVVGDQTRYDAVVAGLQTKIDIANQKDASEAQKETGRMSRAQIRMLEVARDANLKYQASMARVGAENARTKAQVAIAQGNLDERGINDQIKANSTLIKANQVSIANKIGNTEELTKEIDKLKATNKKLGQVIGQTNDDSDSDGSSDGKSDVDKYFDTLIKGLSDDEEDEDNED